MGIFRQALLAIVISGFAGSAHAALTVCNETSDIQALSIGYKGDEDWTSEGWWNIDPNQCVTPVSGDLKQRYYYLRAEVSGGEFKGEDYFFCTSPQVYTIVGDTDCKDRGYDREDFIEVDTGETAKDFTYTLTRAAMEAAQSSGGEKLGLEFCNQTRDTQSIAVGYKGEEDFTSEGWWNIDPDECVTVLPGALKTRYYYYRAEVGGGDFDGEPNYTFCTTPEEFTIVGDTGCDARGYDTETFREVDTGATSKAFTVTLTASGDSGGADTGNDNTASTGDPLPGLTFCNETSHTQAVSIGYEGEGGWTSEGWWNVEPNDCTTVLRDPLAKQYYYYRAEVNGGEFDGVPNYTFCTTPEAYTIVGDQNCEARGYHTETFREINVGVGITSYTMTLIPNPDDPAVDTSGSDSGTATDSGSAVDNMATSGAGLEVCNDTVNVQALSIGYEGADGWTSEGWWNVEPGDCVTPTLDDQPHRYFYYRAEVDGGDFLGQNYFFCTTPEAYTIVGDSECEARGYDREDFREIDTGGTEGMFTFTLVSETGGAVQGAAPDNGTDSGIEFDRLGTGSTAEPEPMPEPEPEPEPEPMPEPEPEPEPMPEPEPEQRDTGRRGGSRGG